MKQKTADSNIEARLSSLSQQKRELLTLLQKQREAARTPGSATSGGTPTLIGSERFKVQGRQLRDPVKLQEFYDSVNRQLDTSPFGAHAFFLNYGYVPNDNPQHARIKLPENYLSKNATRLILELIGDVELREEHTVLDVGCGRGGVHAVLRRFFHIGSYTGLDLSPAAIDFCRRTWRDPRSTFVVGRADELPFEDKTFDVLTNVESSHGYPDVPKFFREVYRVLRPGGCFLYTDVFLEEQVEESTRLLRELGFELEREQDITGNVLLSCDETAATHSRVFPQGNDQSIMASFLGMPDSRLYQEMKSGRQRYLLYRFSKPRGSSLGTGERDRDE